MSRWTMRLWRGSPQLDCHEVGETLQRYLDGDIDAERAHRIEAHLELCVLCGLEVAAYQRIKATLAAQRPAVSAESVQRLRDFGERLARGEVPLDP